MSSITGLHTMKKAELVTVLEDLGEMVNEKWTKEELISRIKEVAPKEASNSMAGVPSLQKSELVSLAVSLGVVHTVHTTRGDLLRKIRAYYEDEQMEWCKTATWWDSGNTRARPISRY